MTAPTAYQPSKTILKKYAAILVNFALNSGAGIKPGEVVFMNVPDVAKPLALELQNTVLKAGGQPLLHLIPTGLQKSFFQLASDEQITFFPEMYLRERAALIDHTITVLADPDPQELKKVKPEKVMLAMKSKKPMYDWLNDKEVKGRFTWTLGLWGTEAKAAEAGLSLEEYWKQIIKACYLDKPDPIAEWKKVFQLQMELKRKLNSMEIEWLHVRGQDVNLKIKLGADRDWHGGSGRNMPSFELFTSPDWRGTEGWIFCNQPIYRYGNILRDCLFQFKDGLVTKARARVGNPLLQSMLKTPNANKVGEYSLTDKRMSRITHFMAETLFDENIGGPFGNTHFALGRAYKDCFRGDQSQLIAEEWEERGFNDSAEHTDFISTTDRMVTATLTNGVQKIIYKDGMFVV